MKERKNQKAIRSNWILEAIGVILLIASVVQVTFNWENAYTKDFSFFIDDTSVLSDYVDIGGTLELTSFQKTGTSSCKYNLYRKARTASSYTSIYTGVSYSNNNEISDIWSVSFGSWADTRFKMTKTAGKTTQSTICVAIEES
ncbi:hypothetical protein [Anaeromicropila populeti]|uniref:Uncharacterized protein n=1 Tax=Anaeromicropila populeti TaxID=37658 RepID=A0A1I6JS56_9FIRM|nr:hypothetical protein [Anaeromicropila populeti]SFR81773.1 hypothetical protein SAMN05661086_01936 [Anaeromicropila populeti]